MRLFPLGKTAEDSSRFGHGDTVPELQFAESFVLTGAARPGEHSDARIGLGEVLFDVSLSQLVAIAVDAATGDDADDAPSFINDRVALVRRAGALVIQSEAHDFSITRLFMGDISGLADKEGLEQPDISAEAGIRRIEVKRPGQFVTVQRQTGFDAQAVAGGQTAGHGPQPDQVTEQVGGPVRMNEQLVGSALTGIARARN